jgi:hypothetical protein
MSQIEERITAGDTDKGSGVFDVLSGEVQTFHEMHETLLEQAKQGLGEWAVIQAGVVHVCTADTTSGAIKAGREEFSTGHVLAGKILPPEIAPRFIAI